MTPRMAMIIAEVAQECNILPSQITTQLGRKNARGPVLFARIQTAKRLHAAGYSTSQIGAAMGRDRSTVTFYLGRIKKRTPARPKWQTPSIGHLFCIGCRLCTFRAPEPPPPPPTPPTPKKRYLIPYAGAEPEERWKERP